MESVICQLQHVLGRHVIRRHERLDVHFLVQTTPHLREKRDDFFLSLDPRLPQEGVVTRNWFAARCVGSSAAHANQRAAL